MRRRDFILLGSAVASPLVAEAQVSPKRRPLHCLAVGGTTQFSVSAAPRVLPALAPKRLAST